MNRFFVFLLVPCLLLSLSLPTFASSTSAPVLSPDLSWKPIFVSDSSVTLETTIFGGTLYVGDFSGNVKEFPGGSAHGVALGSTFPTLTLDLGGLTSFPGLFSAGNVNVSISCIPRITFLDNGATYTLSDPSSSVTLLYGYQPTSGFSVSGPYTERSLSGSLDSVSAFWGTSSSNWTAAYLNWTFSYSLPSDLPINARKMDIVCPIVVRISGSPDALRPYLSGSVVGDALWDGLIIDNIISNNKPSINLLPDISSDGTTFITNVITHIRSLPWVQSTLVISLTWVIVAFVLWRRK